VSQIGVSIPDNLGQIKLATEIQTTVQMGQLILGNEVELPAGALVENPKKPDQTASVEKAKELISEVHQQIQDKVGRRFKLPDERTLSKMIGIVREEVRGKQKITVLDSNKLRKVLTSLNTNNPEVIKNVVDQMASRLEADLQANEYREIS
jgi:hypothetical protein